MTFTSTFDLNNEQLGSTIATNNVITLLNSSTLTVGQFTKTRTDANKLATLNFNGGTLKQYGSPGVLLPADSSTFTGVTCNVQTNGAKVDVTGYPNVEIDHALVHDSALGAAADGGLTVIGAGGSDKLIIEGNNTYTGPTVVNNCILQIGNLTSGGGTLGTGAVTLTNTTSLLYLDRTDNYVLPNAIGGLGSLDQEGFGTVTLTLPNTYSGPTTVGSGTLILTGAQSTSGVSVSSGAGFGGGTSVSALNLSNGAILVPSDGTNLATITVTNNNGIINGGNVTVTPGNLGAVAYSLGFHKVLAYTGAHRRRLHTIVALACRWQH